MLTDIEDLVIQDISGLCQSCKHAPDCMYRKHATKAVLQCEVFEGHGEALDYSAPGMLPEKGLCSNCSKSPFCHLHKRASGVWHCEEYE